MITDQEQNSDLVNMADTNTNSGAEGEETKAITTLMSGMKLSEETIASTCPAELERNATYYTPIGSWTREENGATFEAGIMAQNSNGDGDGPEQVLVMKMDPNFLMPEERSSIIRSTRGLLKNEIAVIDCKLSKLLHIYCQIVDDETLIAEACQLYAMFKELMERCASVEFLQKRCSYAVFANIRANKCWEKLMARIAKEVEDMRPLVHAIRMSKTKRAKLEKLCGERKKTLGALEVGVPNSKRGELEKEMEKLKLEVAAFKAREEELNTLVKERKAFMAYLLRLVKQLDLKDHDLMEQTLNEFKENIENDAGSMLL